MNADDALERILRALTTELRATRNIGSIEARVGRSRGYFSKVAGRKWRMSLDVLFETLEVLDIDPEIFFANAFAQRTPADRPAPQRGFAPPSRFGGGGPASDSQGPRPTNGRRW